MSEQEDYCKPINFSEIYQYRVGGISVTFGVITSDYKKDFVVAAALSEDDLRREQCGYGTNPAEATADLFRLMRSSLRSIRF